MNGVLIIDKSAGPTSHDVVASVRRVLRMKKVGHTGTLDPAATGVLPIVLGKATKLSRYLVGCDKSYRGVITLVAPTQLCTEGEELSPEQAQILALLKRKTARFKPKLHCKWWDGQFKKY